MKLLAEIVIAVSSFPVCLIIPHITLSCTRLQIIFSGRSGLLCIKSLIDGSGSGECDIPAGITKPASACCGIILAATRGHQQTI